jgi:hypothetical protein
MNPTGKMTHINSAALSSVIADLALLLTAIEMAGGKERDLNELPIEGAGDVLANDPERSKYAMELAEKVLAYISLSAKDAVGKTTQLSRIAASFGSALKPN